MARVRKNRRRLLVLFVVAEIVPVVVGRLRGYRVGGNTVVRCRRGHLFTTLWIPGASVKSLRLGWWRIQRCPVGPHWSIVAPVKESEMTPAEMRTAHETRDIGVP